MKKITTLFLAMALGFSLNAQSSNSTIRFSGIPALGYNSDDGFGAGVLGSMYFDEEGYDPYKMAIGIKAYITTKLVNSHHIKIDRIGAFGLPLRLSGRLGFYSTISQNYCGMASDANCDETIAQNKAQGLPELDRDKFIKNYYHHRYMMFYGDLNSRWLLWKDIAKLELMAGYRGQYYMNRDFKEKGFYPGSKFEEDFKSTRTEGYLSTLEVGLMLDKRDNEPAPTSGYWLETSVRGASSIIGSNWDYLGTNLSARFYWPLDEKHDLVIASQTIVDAIFGDLPYDAMSRVGGSQALNDLNAFGGQYIGRGISEQRYVGRFKLIEQAEFRYRFWSFNLWNQNFDLNLAGFADLGMTAWDYSRFSHDMKKVYIGFGSGLRISWNKTFVVRVDMGVSPQENFAPKVYLTVGNIF